MSEKSINQWKRKELVSLPRRQWNKQSVYDTVLVLPARERHDSGWGMMVVIGCVDGVPVEIASSISDDIEWLFPEPVHGARDYGRVRSDCAFASGAIQFHGVDVMFRVGIALSTITIEAFTAPQTGSR